MIRTTNKTIRDYWQFQGSRVKPGVHNEASKGTFHRLMASVTGSGPEENRSSNHGLRLEDYWRRCLPAKQHPLDMSNPKPMRPSPKSPESTPARQTNAHQASPAVSDPHDQSVLQKKIDRAAAAAARKYELPAGLLTSVIRHESNFNPRAVSSAGAQGLMQLMPATARELGVDDPFDIHQNIDGGARYLQQMLAQFDGDLRQALAAYNAGPGTVRRYGGVPPYPETRRYIRKVMASAAETV